MRQLLALLACSVLFLAGCATGPFSRPGPGKVATPSVTPRAETVVAHLNQECRGINSVQFERVSIQAKQGLQTFGVTGDLVYQKPKNFRMMATALGSTFADVGSNEREFWFWFNEGEKLQYYCAHEDLARARGMGIPIHPDWVAEALCLQEFGPADQYQVRTANQKLELVSTVTSPQGQTMTKVTTVALSGPMGGRVVGHQLRTAEGTEIWSADVTEYQNVGGFTIPRKITLRCPSQKMEMQFKMDGARVNSLNATAQTFRRPGNYQSIDLARASAPTGTPQSIQRVRGNSQ
jgi:outer membrane biogenesis lipoprotein LolB